MPAIILFQRRTFIAGDDLQPAAMLSMCLRSGQLALLLGPLFHRIYQMRHDEYNDGTNNDDNCQFSSQSFFQLLFCYAIMSAVIGVCGVLLESRLAYWSRHGCPTEPEPRTSKVTKLLQLRFLPFSLGLMIVWVIGMVTLTGYAPKYYQCLQQLQVDDDDQGAEATADDNNDDDFNLVNDPRNWELWCFAFGMLLATQFLELVFTAAYLLHLFQQDLVVDTLLDLEHGEFLPIHMTNHELVEEMWADRCARTCHCLSYASCFLFGGRDLLGQGSSDAFGDVARALADYLETRGVLDLVPSDIIAGLVVLQKLQRQRVRQARIQFVASDMGGHAVLDGGAAADENAVLVGDSVLLPLDDMMTAAQQVRSVTPRSIYRRNSQGSIQRLARSVLDRHSVDDMRVLEEGARYAKYALAIYTWVLYIYEHPLTGMARLSWEGCFACCRNDKQSQQQQPGSAPSRRLFTHQGKIDDDNLCQMHKHALLLTAGLESADLVYAQLRSGFTENPYCILLDHEWRSIVVSIRGTFSLEDVVTDVLIDPESMEKLGEEFGFDGKGQFGHGGTLACVRNVYRDLQRHRLLDHLLLGEDAPYQDYTLRLVGHSLGAATCTILGYMLRPTFPTLRCVNYGPPGCCLTWDMAVNCRNWCSSFILDTDLLSRLNRDSLESLRDEVLELYGLIKVPKIEIVQRLLQNATLDEVLYDPEEVPDSEYRQRLERFKAIQQERRLSRGSLRDVRLFPPGNIVHLVKTGEQQSFMQGVQKCLTCWTSNVGFAYTAVRVENDDLNEIIVSATMGTDHFPNRIRDILDSISASYGLPV